MLALIEAKKAGLLQFKNWMANIVSGVIVGVVALPLAMAFAIASGAEPEQGLYTAIIAGFIVAIFGGSRFQIAGPTGAFIVVLFGITHRYGIDGLQIATLMAGFILLFLGLAKMGSVIKFIPDPVIVGFTAGIAVIIWVGQWQEFLGLPEVSSQHFHIKVLQLVQALPKFQITTTMMAVFSLLLVIYSSKIPGLKRVPGPLTALLVATILQFTFQFEGIKTVGSAFGGIPQGLPKLTLPSITWAKSLTLIGPAFTIAMLGAIESLLSAVVADSMTGTRHNSNQELIGQGLANIVTPFFGGFAATGAIARTATNIRNGATSPLSGIVHSLTLLFILLLLAPLAIYIPLAALAAILFVVAWNMSEAKHFIKILRQAPNADIVILLITFFLTVFADLVIAVNIGVILAMLNFLRRMSASVEVKQITDEALSQEFSKSLSLKVPPDVWVFTVEGPLFFGAMENVKQALVASHAELNYLIIRLRWVPFIDITGLQTLEAIIEDFKKQGVTVIVSGANQRVTNKLKKADILHKLGEKHYFKRFDDALTFAGNRAHD